MLILLFFIVLTYLLLSPRSRFARIILTICLICWSGKWTSLCGEKILLEEVFAKDQGWVTGKSLEMSRTMAKTTSCGWGWGWGVRCSLTHLPGKSAQEERRCGIKQAKDILVCFNASASASSCQCQTSTQKISSDSTLDIGRITREKRKVKRPMIKHHSYSVKERKTYNEGEAVSVCVECWAKRKKEYCAVLINRAK